jgi:hypothetical protein
MTSCETHVVNVIVKVVQHCDHPQIECDCVWIHVDITSVLL